MTMVGTNHRVSDSVLRLFSLSFLVRVLAKSGRISLQFFSFAEKLFSSSLDLRIFAG